MFTIKFHKNIVCFGFHDILQYFMKCCTPMSDISRLMFLSPTLSHCFVRELFITAIELRFQAVLLAVPALASSSARSSLITAYSCFASLSRMSRFACFPF